MTMSARRRRNEEPTTPGGGVRMNIPITAARIERAENSYVRYPGGDYRVQRQPSQNRSWQRAQRAMPTRSPMRQPLPKHERPSIRTGGGHWNRTRCHSGPCWPDTTTKWKTRFAGAFVDHRYRPGKGPSQQTAKLYIGARCRAESALCPLLEDLPGGPTVAARLRQGCQKRADSSVASSL